MTTRAAARSKRINLRATKRQEHLIRIGAQTSGVSVTDFIIDSACREAEHLLIDRREFYLDAKQWQAFTDALDRPANIKPELVRLFSESGVPGRK